MKKRFLIIAIIVISLIIFIYCFNASEIKTITFGKEKINKNLNSSISNNYKYNILSNGTIQIEEYTDKSITSIIIPSTLDGKEVTSIGDNAFINCYELKKIEIPNSITNIGNYAFNTCYSLTDITIPSKVTSIGNNPFLNCTSLTVINVDTNNKNFSSDEGVLFNKNKTKLISYPIGKKIGEALNTEYVIPNTVKIVGKSAFKSAELITVEIPNGVVSIEDEAFLWCMDLEEIEIPISVTTIGKKAFSGGNSLEIAKIPGTVTNIAEDAFEDCIDLVIYCKTGSLAEKIAGDTITYICDDISPTIIDVYKEGNTLIVEANDFGNKGTELEYVGVGMAQYGYSFDGGKTWQKETRKTYSEEDPKINIQVIDAVGNIKIYEYNTVTDTIPPTIQNLKIVDTNMNMITVEVTAQDNESGLAEEKTYTYYKKKTTEEEYELVQETKEKKYIYRDLESDTQYNFKVVVRDSEGNEAFKEIIGVTEKIQLPIVAFKKNNTLGDQIKVRSSVNEEKNWINTNVYIEIENESQALESSYKVYKLSEGNTQEISVNNNLLETETGEYKIVVRTTDGVNIVEKTYYIDVDKIMPRINIQSGNTIINEIMPVITENESGKRDIQLKKDGQNVSTYTGEKISESGEYELKVTDNAGNSTTINFLVIEPLKEIGELTATYGDLLKNVRLPQRYSWEYSTGENRETKVVGNVGINTFTVTYTPINVNKYKTLTGIEVKVKVEDEAVSKEQLTISSNKHDINGNIIQNVQPKLEISNFKNNIISNATYIIVLKNQKEVKSGYVETGMEILLRLGEEEEKFGIVVKGDVNGDGQANITDIFGINSHRLNKNKLLGLKEKSADVDGNGIVNISDIFRLNSYRLNKISQL